MKKSTPCTEIETYPMLAAKTFCDITPTQSKLNRKISSNIYFSTYFNSGAGQGHL